MKQSFRTSLVFLLLFVFGSGSGQVDEIPHYERKDNFTTLRILILNDENQVLMCNDQGYWGMPWVNLTKRQFLNEAVDSMAAEYGIEISNLELRGQFCFKYDYKPNVTFRNYYVAQYKSGNIKIPGNTIETEFEEVEWVDITNSYDRIQNTGIQKITQQILETSQVIWGGSFMVSHTDEDHPTKMVEDFYPLSHTLFHQQLGVGTDTIELQSFHKYSRMDFGMSYINNNGNVSKYTKHGGSFDMYFAEGKRNHFYGFNMNVALSNKLREFSIPQGFEHYDSPATVLVGLFYGQTFGNPKESHFQASAGVNYGWLLHRKRDEDIGGYHGLVPQLELSHSFITRKQKFSEFQYTSQYTPMKYDPSLSDKFIDVFLGYRQLLLNNEEGQGGQFYVGIRYKVNKYSIDKNLN